MNRLVEVIWSFFSFGNGSLLNAEAISIDFG